MDEVLEIVDLNYLVYSSIIPDTEVLWTANLTNGEEWLLYWSIYG